MFKFKKLLSIVLCAIFSSIILFSTIVHADGTLTLKINKKSIQVGDTVTVTISAKSNEDMFVVDTFLKYPSDLFEVVSSSETFGGNGTGTLQVASPNNGKTKDISFTFKALKSGSGRFTTANSSYVNIDENRIGFSGEQGANIAVTDITLSSNANLKSLSLSKGSLSPKFSASTTVYNATVSYETENITVYATASDTNATISGIKPNTKLKIGKNNLEVTVTAPNGTQKKYTIVVTRLNEGELTDEQQQEIEQNEIKEKLETTIDETTYSVVTDISSVTLFKGFSASTTEYNGLEVPVAKDDNGVYTVYYLKTADSDLLVPYTYNSDLKTFERLKYLSLGDNLYIFEKIPDEYKAYNNLYASNLNISDFSVECFSNNDEKLSDFHYVYCYSNGQYSIYRYDSLEGTMQRYPEFMKATDVDEITENKDNLLTRFASLSLNGKVIIICLLVAILGALALIVFFVIFLVKKFAKKEENIFFESYEDDFEEISEENDEMTEAE